MIQPIVEGHGEVDAVPVLLRSILFTIGVFDLRIGAPIRRKRSELLRTDPLCRTLDLARRQPGCAGILLVLDADDDCPREIAAEIEDLAAETVDVPCAVVVPNREFEAWFLASIESLAPGAAPYENPEAVRDAKGEVERILFPKGYHPRVDQPSLAARMDLRTTYQRSRSFRRLATAFGELVRAEGAYVTCPPPQWQ